MNILSVSDLMNPAIGGGATDRDYQMCRHLALAGESVDLLTTDWQLDKEYVSKLSGVKCHAVKAVYCRYLVPLGARKWLEHRIAKYDVVHISKNWSLLANIAANVANQHGVAYVFSAMGFVAIHNRSRLLKRVYRKYLTIPLLRRASAFIAVTAEERADLIDAGAAPAKIRLIPNGILPDDFLHKDDVHFRGRYGLAGQKIMLFIGRMDPIKGVHLMIDAFAQNRDRIKDWVLVLVGTRTAYRSEMERKVATLNLGKQIVFVDPIFGKDKSEAYHAAEFVVIPSVKDAMTIIAPEAACCKKPVLITETSGFSELARRGGALQVAASVEGLARGLDVLTSDNCDRTAMGRKGYDYVMSALPWERLAPEYLALFRSVADAPAR